MRQEEWTVEAGRCISESRYRNLPVKNIRREGFAGCFIPECIAAGGKNRTCGRNKWKRVGLLVSRCGFAESREADGAVYVSSSGARDGAFSFLMDRKQTMHCSWRRLRRLRHHMFILSRKDWGHPTHFEYLF